MLRHAGVLIALTLAACFEPRAVACLDGTICPSGAICDTVHHQCLRPEQQTACAGLAEGATCPIGREVGVCLDGVCLQAVCGDGLIELDEQCDGSPPPRTCFDEGYDAGATRCNQRVCVADTTGCRSLGWKPMLTPGTLAVWDLSGAPGLGLAARSALLLQLRGEDWVPVVLGSSNIYVASVYAASASSGFALTTEGVFRYDGAGWARDPGAGAGFSTGVVFGSGPADVFALGVSLSGAATIGYHFDGQRWTSVPMPTLAAAGEPTKGWAGPGGAWFTTSTKVFRWTGAAWSAVAAPLDVVGDVKGFGSSVFVAGTVTGKPVQALVLRARPGGWDRFDVTAELRPDGDLVGLGGRAGDDFYVFTWQAPNVVHFDGVNWQRADAPPSPIAIAAVGDQVFAGTITGILRASPDWLVDLTMPGGSDIYNTVVTGASCTSVDVAAIRNDSATRLLHFDGGGWTEAPSVAYPVDALATAPDGVSYGVGRTGAVLQRDAAAWKVIWNLPPTPRAIAALAGGHLAIAGDDGQLHRFDGTWHTDRLGVAGYTGIAMVADDDIVAVGPGGIAAFDGRAWAAVAVPSLPAAHLAAVWAAPDGTVVAVGQRGLVVHREHGAWRVDPSLPYTDLAAVHGASARDVFAIAVGGTLFHFDGERWAPVRFTTLGGVSVWASPTCTYLGGGLTNQIVLDRLVRHTTW